MLCIAADVQVTCNIALRSVSMHVTQSQILHVTENTMQQPSLHAGCACIVLCGIPVARVQCCGTVQGLLNRCCHPTQGGMGLKSGEAHGIQGGDMVLHPQVFHKGGSKGNTQCKVYKHCKGHGQVDHTVLKAFACMFVLITSMQRCRTGWGYQQTEACRNLQWCTGAQHQTPVGGITWSTLLGS